MRDMFVRNADRIADLPGLETDDRLYFRDLYDGLVRVSELVDSYRDLLSGATDMYLSTVANRQGEINKQLTIIATIFLPAHLPDRLLRPELRLAGAVDELRGGVLRLRAGAPGGVGGRLCRLLPPQGLVVDRPRIAGAQHTP